MIVVVDTNVIISGLLRPSGPAGTVLRLAASGMLKLAHDNRILLEYREVLSRRVFGFSTENINALLDQIEGEGIFVAPEPLPFRLPDPSDEPFLEVALGVRAEALITGNKKHFSSRNVDVRILSPSEFVTAYGLLRRPRKT